MATYDLTKITELRDLQKLAQKQQAKNAEITKKIEGLSIPTKVSELTNDAGYQTNAQVAAAINTAIAKTGHASFKKVDAVPAAADATENILYLVLNSKTSHYDIYALISGKMELLDDTTVDLSGYVVKETGKSLMTDAERTKLQGIAEGANKYVHPSHTAAASGLYKVTVDALGHVTAVTKVVKSDITALGIPAQDTTYSAMTGATASAAGKSGLVPAPAAGTQGKFLRGDGTWQTPANTTYTAATASKDGLMAAADKSKLDGLVLATEAEVDAMLTEIYGD